MSEIWSCAPEAGIDGREFLGTWKISESSPGYNENMRGLAIKISKKDIFFWVEIEKDGKDILDLFETAIDADKELKETTHKFQLGPDKKSLIPLSAISEYALLYHDDNNTIQSSFGWFKKL
jgi:hypothetical protein